MSAPIVFIERPRTIGIAGGSGFVGQEIIFGLARAGHAIRLLTGWNLRSATSTTRISCA